MLNQNNAERLVKVLNLLSSPYDGERAAAGAAATRILKDLGLSWGEVIRTPSIVPGHGADIRSDLRKSWRNGDAADYRRMARFCWDHRWGHIGTRSAIRPNNVGLARRALRSAATLAVLAL
jgi:hypothetical protein